MCKLSIIVVTYNAEFSIYNTIQSIIPYLNENIELICMDGNSTDNTVDILTKYKKYIKHLVSESDNGVYDAMNKSAELANGEYLLFINSGDELIKLDITTLEDTSTCFYWDEARDVIKRDKTTKTFLCRNTPCHQSVFYKRRDFVPFDLKVGLAADFEQLVRILKLRAEPLGLNSSVVKYANPGLSSQYFKPTIHQFIKQMALRVSTIHSQFGISFTFMCVIFSLKTLLIKLFTSFYSRFNGKSVC
ncbi:glycosyltransferase [Vibrio sp. RC27]